MRPITDILMRWLSFLRVCRHILRVREPTQIHIYRLQNLTRSSLCEAYDGSAYIPHSLGCVFACNPSKILTNLKQSKNSRITS